jgi:nucleotide-binding universal stress UspA family protein
MKTLLVLSDFSNHSNHAAVYAFDLAKRIKANLLLCNAYGQAERSTLSENSLHKLEILKKQLLEQAVDIGFEPEIDCLSVSGSIDAIIKSVSPLVNIKLIIAGTHNEEKIGDIIMGNDTTSLINNIDFPLLLVPPDAAPKQLANMAFATDLRFVENDISAIALLVALAQPLHARILLTHIYNPKTDNTPVFETWIGGFLADIVNKVTYARIDYKIVNEEIIENGLDWLIETENIDMLAMVHYPKNGWSYHYTIVGSSLPSSQYQ